jgi:hypothetical protein
MCAHYLQVCTVDAADAPRLSARLSETKHAVRCDQQHPSGSLATAPVAGPNRSCGEASSLPQQAYREIAAEPVVSGLHHIYRATA